MGHFTNRHTGERAGAIPHWCHGLKTEIESETLGKRDCTHFSQVQIVLGIEIVGALIPHAKRGTWNGRERNEPAPRMKTRGWL
jgi:hypothetical protein